MNTQKPKNIDESFVADVVTRVNRGPYNEIDTKKS